jgi:hypothetical protein
MDLSYEARWLNLRRQLAEDAATLAALAEGTADSSKALNLHGKAAYAVTALRHMDELDRVTGPIA